MDEKLPVLRYLNEPEANADEIISVVRRMEPFAVYANETLYAAYRKIAKEPISRVRFGRALAKLGLTPVRTNGQRGWFLEMEIHRPLSADVAANAVPSDL